jgi:hypothetical protein
VLTGDPIALRRLLAKHSGVRVIPL